MSYYREKYPVEVNAAEYMGLRLTEGGWVERWFGFSDPNKVESGWCIVCHISKFDSYIADEDLRKDQ